MANCWNDGRVLGDGTIIGEDTPSPLVAEEYGYTGPDMVLCLVCVNDGRAHGEALRHAKTRWWQRVSR